MRIVAEQWVPLPLRTVFAFFSDPNNLPKLMPPSQQVRIESLRLVAAPSSAGGAVAAAGVGSEIVVSLRPIPFIPVRVQWTARIVDFAPEQRFADEQARGPFQRWLHRHEFQTDERDGHPGTLVRDVVEFDVGWGWIGEFMERLVIARQVRGTFRHRQQVLLPILLKNQEKC